MQNGEPHLIEALQEALDGIPTQPDPIPGGRKIERRRPAHLDDPEGDKPELFGGHDAMVVDPDDRPAPNKELDRGRTDVPDRRHPS